MQLGCRQQTILYIFCQSCADIQSSCGLTRPAAHLGGDTQRTALSEVVRGTSSSKTVQSNAAKDG
eukprot:5282255-Amphidinium_carterae.1